jgi:hypothetical protein
MSPARPVPKANPKRKETITVPSTRPRNPVALAARKAKAGEHGPDEKAQRKHANDALRKRPLGSEES